MSVVDSSMPQHVFMFLVGGQRAVPVAECQFFGDRISVPAGDALSTGLNMYFVMSGMLGFFPFS